MNSPERFGVRPAQAAAALLAAGENERGAVMTTIKKAFEWARSDEMRAFLARSTASFDDLLDDKIDVFIAVPLDQLGAQAVFMRLLINIVLGTVVRQDGRRVAAKRILMVLDEFVRLGRMEKLLDIANVAAGSGIEALFVTQDKGQIEAVYGKSDTDSLLGSCVTVRIFGLGRLESNTAEWAASALGDQTVITRSVQAPTRFGESQRISTSEQRAEADDGRSDPRDACRRDALPHRVEAAAAAQGPGLVCSPVLSGEARREPDAPSVINCRAEIGSGSNSSLPLGTSGHRTCAAQ